MNKGFLDNLDQKILQLKMNYLINLYFLSATILFCFGVHFTIAKIIPNMLMCWFFYVLLSFVWYFSKKGSISLNFSTHLINSLITSLATVAFFISGGLKAPALFWLPVLCFSTLVLLGKRAMYIWAIIFTLIVTSVLIAQVSGFEFSNYIGEADTFKLHFVHYILLMTYIISLGLLQSSLQDKVNQYKDKLHLQLYHENRLSSLGELSAGIGHELNNPLAVAYIHFGKIKDSVTQNQIPNADNVDKLSISLKRMDAILKSISQLARKDDGRNELFDANQSLKDNVGLFREMYQTRGINLTLSIKSESSMVLGNEQKFSQVIANLLSNAKDAFDGIDKAQKTIAINSSLDNQQFIIKIADNGKGIAKDKVDKIFDSFYTTKDVGQGTGLGLSISKRFISDLGGQLTCESTEDKGTTFTISLPLRT